MTSSIFMFDQPWWLLALPVAALFLLRTARHSRAVLPVRSARAATTLRLAVAGLIIAALAGTHLARRTDRQTVIFLLDVSQSIRPDQRARSIDYLKRAISHLERGDRAGVIVFGKSPSLSISPSASPNLNGLAADIPADATDLAAALRLATSAFPADMGKRLVLLTDGNETRGDAGAEASPLRLAATTVDLAPVEIGSASTPPAPEALVASLRVPAEVQVNAPYALHVVLSSTTVQSGELAITRDGLPFSHQRVSLNAGDTAVAISDAGASVPGLHHFEARLRPDADQVTQNNVGSADIVVRGRPQVLYVTDDPAIAALPRILAAQGIEAAVCAPGSLPDTLAKLSACDAVLLSDVPASEFSSAQMQAINVSVRTFGVGLGMIGGSNSYGAGQWTGTPVATCLPVRMEIPPQRKLPPAAIVVVLDASGSMAQTESGVEKVQLAARAAVNLMQSLQPVDQIAVTSVTTSSAIVVPLQPATHMAQAQALIEDVHAGGGGIYCRQGLQDAYSLIADVHASLKHVILVADTTDSEQKENSIALAAYMRRRYHITTTVVGIGRSGDPDSAYQQSVATAGGGQWTAVAEAADLPRAFRRDLQSLQQSWFVETPVRPIAAGGDPMLAGISFAAAPPLLGHNIVSAKPGASVAIAAPNHDPVLVHAPVGLGRAFAFTADDRPHWSARWLAWPQNARFWAQTVRWTLRSSAPASFAASVESDGGRARLILDTDTSAAASSTSFAAAVASPDLTTRPLILAPSGPRRFAASFDADVPGTYVVSVRQTGSSRTVRTLRLAVPYAPEYRALGPNLPLLMRLVRETGGQVQPDPARLFASRRSVAIGAFALAPSLLLIAALLFIADIAVRRLALELPPMRRLAERARHKAVSAAAASFPNAAPIAPEDADLLRARPVASRLPHEADTPEPPPDDPFPQVASLHSRTPPPPSRRD